MTLIIVAILLIGYILLATANYSKINKAAVAIFIATVGWVLYICYGTDYVMSQHPDEYFVFLNGAIPTSTAVKHYIASNIFYKYVAKGAELVLFLLVTMTIVEILNNNGCFDFFKQMLRTRNSRKLLWYMTIITFLVSANLDNLTVTTMMLVVMHEIIPSRRYRMIYGSAIIVAANSGGALTVIGDPIGLLLWNSGAVTATDYSLSMAIPCLLSFILPNLWLSRMLPERIETQWTAMPYRGDDTNLKVWQRLMMLIVGIGGLWFIPSFHDITKLSPFVGAMCVLAVLWIVNEIMNRKLMNVDQMIQRKTPRVLQYGIIQLMLFVMGMILAVGVAQETGVIHWLSRQCDIYIGNIWGMGIIAGVISTILDNFATAVSFVSLYSIGEGDWMTNGIYWKIIAYCSSMGGSVLLLGSMSGLALVKMERIHVGWYLKNVGLSVFVSSLVGILVLYITG